MNKLLAGLFAGLSLLALDSAAFALERVMVGELEATRLVIAPPRTPLEATIRDGLRDAVAGATAGSRAEADARQLYYVYGARHFEPLWLTQDDGGQIVFSEPARTVLTLFENAYLEGLDPADYLGPDLDVAAAAGDPAKLAALESAFSAAMLAYARDAYTGRLDPRTVSDTIDIAPKPLDEKALLERLAASDDPAAILQSLHPDHPEFLALRALLARHYDGSVAERAPIGDGPLLRPGMSDPRVPLLRERLGVSDPVALPAEVRQAVAALASNSESDLPAAPTPSTVYDQPLVAAVEAFQTRMGLNPDGVVGPATIAAINGADGATRETIIVNMERWRWLPEDLGDFHVLVNIPEYRVEIARHGEVVWDSRVIVGRSGRETPLFSDRIRHVVTNPYWNVPPTIMAQDVMPQVMRNPGYLASQNMELLYGGQAIDPWMVDWSQANPNVFRVRQRPGASNALGQVKFLFPNRHDVYLHDTNSPNLFSRSMRAISSGCVRVQDPFGFARALLQFEPNFTVANLESSLGGGNERWFNMNQHVPIHLAYFTIRIDADGETIRTFADLYGHDVAMIEMLGLR